MKISSIQHIIFPIILVATATFAFSNTFGPTKIYQWGLGINASRFPVKAVQFLQQKNYSGNLFNSWKDGGYIQYHLPEVKTFIDGRGLREQAVIAKKVAGMSPYELQQYLDTNQVNAALLANSSTAYLNFFKISPQFKLVHLDDTHTVYFRGTASKDGRQDVFTFQYIKPQGFDFNYLQPLAAGPQAEQVEQEFKRALAQFNDNFSITFQYAIFLDLLNRQAAVDYYLKAAKINPSLGFSHFDLALKGGKSALRHRRWKEAAAILKMSLEFVKPKPEQYFLLGTALYQLKNYEDAEIQFKEHLKIDPWAAPTLTNLGFLFIDTGRYPDAKQSFTKALQLTQKQEGAHYGYALTLEKMGLPAAQEAWKLFLERYPNSKWKNEAQKYLVNYRQNSRK